MPDPRKLRVFLCHSSQDKPFVRELYQKLADEGWIDPWLDEEKLLPGQDWDMEIEKAVEAADVVVVCVSSRSVTKEGYIQREIKFALDIALEKPEGTIFIIPIRLDDCDVPRRLRSWQYVDYFPSEKRKTSYQRFLQSLQVRFGDFQQKLSAKEEPVSIEVKEDRVKDPFPVHMPIPSHLQIVNVSLILGILYIPFYILCGNLFAATFVYMPDSFITRYDVTAYLVFLSIVRGYIAPHILLRNQSFLSKKDVVKIGVEAGVISSIPFAIAVIFIVFFYLDIISKGIFYGLEIALIPDIALGVLSATFTSYFRATGFQKKT